MVAGSPGSSLSVHSALEGAAFPPVQLGAVTALTPVILAPMAGVTDHAFRRLCREFGEAGLPETGFTAEIAAQESPTWGTAKIAPAGLYVTEMVTARALLEGNEQAWAMVQPDPLEPVRSIQLYGTEPKTLGAAAKMLVERGLVDHLDLNFGCPVPKVTRKGGGAAIPWKKDLFEGIVGSVVRAVDEAAPSGPTSIPVTVKMRIGIDDDHITIFDAAQIAQNAGVAAVGIHARTQEQHYSGAARWEWIARLKEQVGIPVFGNGDIFAAEDALKMMQETGCDAVTIGRGAQGRPWLFQEITAAFHGLPTPEPPTLEKVSEALLEHARLALQFDGNEDRVMKELRKHVGWYLRGFAVGGDARRQLNLVSTLSELVEGLSQLDQTQPFPDAAKGSRGRAGRPRKPHLPHGWLDSRYLSNEERNGLVSADDGGSGG